MTANGPVTRHGDAPPLAAAGPVPSAPIVGGVTPGNDAGPWLAAANGTVLPAGTAPTIGSAAGIQLNQPIVAIAR